MSERFEHFVGLIASINKSIQKIKNLEMREFGLKGPHVMSLYYLSKHPDGLTAAELCRRIDVDKAATSRALSQLLEGGYVCYPERKDGRKYRAKVTLTARGAEVAGQIDQIIDRIVDAVGLGLEPEDRRVMYRSLGIVARNLSEFLSEDDDPQGEGPAVDPVV
ncbi:MAG: MarR family winged helix-turn-helix transcriptional regulator [Oscillospiraceae bacterium]